jgi:hypothetical protein
MARNGGGRQAESAGEVNNDPDANEFLDPEANGGIDGDTPEQLVDELAAKGVGALKARGFVTAADAQRLATDIALKVSRELIARERGKITSDNTLMSDFPELRDNESDLFKATRAIYQKAIAMDPEARKTPVALYLAATAAKAALKPKAPAKPAALDPEEEDLYERAGETEAERRQRIASQTPNRNRGDLDDSDTAIGPEARAVLKQMGGVTDEQFLASRKETANMRGRRR